MGAYSKQGSNNKIDKIFIKESGGNIEIAEGYVKNSGGFSLVYKNKKTFSITYNLTGCEINSGYHPTQIVEGTEETIQVDTLEGYTLSGVTPSVTGATIVSWDAQYLIISNPTDNVVITINAKRASVFYKITFSSDYDFSIDGNKTGTHYQTTYAYNPDNPPSVLAYGISMDSGIDSVTINGTYGNYGLDGEYGDTYRNLYIYNPEGDISVTITGMV